jgi:hypothetical protein
MKSRIVLCFAVVLSGLFIVTDRGKCAEAPSGLTVMIDIPEIWKDGKVVIPRSLGNRYPAQDHFFVVIQNTSPGPIVIRDEDDVNRALHFEVTTPEGKTIVLYRRGREYSKYVENEIRLAPGEVTVREIYYERDWDAFPFPHDPKESDTTRTVTMRAVFEEKPLKAAGLSGCWTGRAVSHPYEVVLEDDAV